MKVGSEKTTALRIWQCFRQMAVNVLNQDSTEKFGVQNKRIMALADEDYLEQLLAGFVIKLTK